MTVAFWLTLSCAQEPYSPTNAASISAPFSEPELEQMVAPIALYPDDLIAYVLRAATQPLQVIEADRWILAAGPNWLGSSEFNLALQTKPWIESVKALVTTPHVLSLMDNDLTWTERLGRAYVAQELALFNAIQILRQRASAAGNLNGSTEQTVLDNGQDIAINSTEANTVAIPYYDPNQVYGNWPWSDFPPVQFAVPSGDGFWVPGIFFETIIIKKQHWQHHREEWKHHRLVSAEPLKPFPVIAASVQRSGSPIGAAVFSKLVQHPSPATSNDSRFATKMDRDTTSGSAMPHERQPLTYTPIPVPTNAAPKGFRSAEAWPNHHITPSITRAEAPASAASYPQSSSTFTTPISTVNSHASKESTWRR